MILNIIVNNLLTKRTVKFNSRLNTQIIVQAPKCTVIEKSILGQVHFIFFDK